MGERNLTDILQYMFYTTQIVEHNFMTTTIHENNNTMSTALHCTRATVVQELSWHGIDVR